MAFLHLDFFSETLGYSTQICVVIPQKAKHQIGLSAQTSEKLPVLYLLHGLSDDCTMWQRRSSIERYASEQGIAVIMPSALRSWYCDSPYGNFETYITDELPEICLNIFGCLSEKADNTYIAGLSMGGYGAFKLALAHPEKYAAAASLSGALNTDDKKPLSDEIDRSLCGAPFKAENDIKELSKRLLASNTKPPRLFQCCGTDDFLIESNRKMKGFLKDCGFPLTYRESEGAHSWEYWDREIQNVLLWIKNK